ncbi:hypothetical protein EYF80_040325 [Liparis tanakae]|uniref:Uncharacterized protein n=1 Tax=Liparis tanakae TaxID=230148 RepID=A0A4Z2G9I4_9TELE|nr:hypothetical protein EYF80_040325 [Liparis tanakae]
MKELPTLINRLLFRVGSVVKAQQLARDGGEIKHQRAARPAELRRRGEALPEGGGVSSRRERTSSASPAA